MRSAYFNCIGGASGDMILGAIVDAGASFERLTAALDDLGVGGFSLSHRPAQRGAVRGTAVTVELDELGKRPRRWQDFVHAVERSSLDARVIDRSCAVFQRLAEAEASVHGSTTEEVRLHELGEVDTLVDVVGSVVGLDLLGIEHVYSSPLPTGSGMVNSAHGALPVPTPATSALFAMAKAPTVTPPPGWPPTGEMVTPTGAAILTTLATFRQANMRIERVAHGVGARQSRYYPNVLGLWIGEESDTGYTTDVVLVETNVDDMTGEMLAYAQERLFDIGARDVWFTAIQMKKNRPGTMLSAIVPSSIETEVVELVLRETTTLGVRVRPLSRFEAEREVVEVATSLGLVQVKVKRLGGRNVSVSPEYEDCRRIALARGLSLREVYGVAQREAEQELLGP